MPISALTSLAGPLTSVLQPRNNVAQAIPDSGAPEIQGLGKMPDDGAASSTEPTFGQILQHAIGEVNQSQMHAADLSARFAAGEPLDVHQVMIAAQEASVSLNLAIQVRNKLVDGYQELMKVNV
jgi:flagellar hook-basal body complex protein FliE